MDPAQARARSQPAPTFEDGFGRRQQVVAGTKDPVEVLVLKRELLAVTGFEAAVRERIEQVGRLHHDSFTRVRGLARPKTGAGLLLVSDFVEGTRLSQLLESDQHTLDMSGALVLVGQLMDALAAFHQVVPGCHGAIGPERLILRPDGRLVVADHVFAGALPRLSLDAEAFWQQLQVTVPASGPVFDQQTDILQAGAVALALLLGRTLGPGYPSRIVTKTGSTALSISATLELVDPDIATWISRTIQRPGHQPFSSSADARDALASVLAGVDRVAARQTVLAFYVGASNVPAPRAVAASVPSVTTTTPAGSPVVASPTRSVEVVPAPQPPVSAAPVAAVSVSDMSSVFRAAEEPGDRDEDEHAMPAGASAFVDPVRRFFVPMTRRTIAVTAGVLMLLTTGGAFAAKRYFTPPTAVAKGTLAVATNPVGAKVVIDGEQRGRAPMTVELAAGEHVLQVGLDGASRTVPFKVTAGAEVSQVIDLPKTVASTGALQIRSEPSGARVLVDGQKRGTAPTTIENLTAGVHTVTLESKAGTATQDVTIQGGVTASLVVPLTAPEATPASGWISVTGPFDVQFSEKGQPLGTNHSDKVTATVGRHDIDISNDALGFHVTRTVTVSAGQVATIKVDPPKGSMSLNAVPWAEVWIDGERIGETPMGNVQVAIGTHDVLFRHPDLGEQRFTPTVTLNAPARVSADMRRKP